MVEVASTSLTYVQDGELGPPVKGGTQAAAAALQAARADCRRRDGVLVEVRMLYIGALRDTAAPPVARSVSAWGAMGLWGRRPQDGGTSNPPVDPAPPQSGPGASHAETAEECVATTMTPMEEDKPHVLRRLIKFLSRRQQVWIMWLRVDVWIMGLRVEDWIMGFRVDVWIIAPRNTLVI